MSDEKNRDAQGPAGGSAPSDEELRNAAASRARNKTVMLSPEMTGQVRAMLTDDAQPEAGASAGAGGTYIPPVSEWQSPGDQAPAEPFGGNGPGFENPNARVTSVLDANSISSVEAALGATEPAVDAAPAGFDPMTSVVPSVTASDPAASQLGASGEQ